MTAGDLKVGDPLENTYGCRGSVTSIVDGVVRATYSERGGSWIETYNAEWFQKYGTLIKKLDGWRSR